MKQTYENDHKSLLRAYFVYIAQQIIYSNVHQ